MTYLGSTIFSNIEKYLIEAFPHKKNHFYGLSIILIIDLTQFPLIKDIQLYAKSSQGTALWCTFYMLVTLENVFHQ